MKQGIYEVMDREFDNFVKNNRKYLDVMKAGEVHNLGIKRIDWCRPDMLEHPFNVSYIAKVDGAEGHRYIFMDRDFNKLYDYYDVR